MSRGKAGFTNDGNIILGKSGEKRPSGSQSDKALPDQPPIQQLKNTTYMAGSRGKGSLACPECGGTKLWKAGLRSTWQGSVQRWICRDCAYRFSRSENSQLSKNVQKLQTEAVEPTGSEGSEWSEGLQRIHTKPIYSDMDKPLLCRVGAAQTKGAKNLVEVETRTQEKAAGATTPTQADIKGKIVELAWHLKKQGRSVSTINTYSKYLTILFKKGANLNDPESVKDVISQQEHWAVSTKKQSVTAYTAYCLKHGIKWDPPNYEPHRRLPWIPLEKELDALIASCGKKMAATLQTLKETGARIGEVLALKWIDIDSERCTITINTPEKNSNPRIFKVNQKLVSMLNALPKQSDKVFNGILPQWAASNFRQQRKRAALKLQNPRLNQIHFHTFRHWKATMEYAKTKDILHVMQILGHKRIDNTLLYTQLVNFESDEYHSAVAKDTTEAQKLIEVGFEYVCTHETLMLFRKRK